MPKSQNAAKIRRVKVFFDSSVIVSALISSSGASARLTQLSSEKVLIGITSVGCLEEILGKSPKLGKSIEQISNFVEKCFVMREKVTQDEATRYLSIVSDPKDTHVLAGAVLTKCQYLVTLDKKHLLTSATKDKLRPLKIVSPKEFLELII